MDSPDRRPPYEPHREVASECLTLLTKEQFQVFFERVLLGRHGKTELNIKRVLQGSSDTGLVQEGIEEMREQSLQLAQSSEYRIRSIVSSGMKRAVQTADIFSAQLAVPATIWPGLEELNHGSWEGLSITDDILTDPEKLAWTEYRIAKEENGPPHGGESFFSFIQRVNSAIKGLHHLVTRQDQHEPGKYVLLISHADVTRCIRFLLWLAINHGSEVTRDDLVRHAYHFSHSAPGKFIKIPHGVFTMDTETAELKSVL